MTMHRKGNRIQDKEKNLSFRLYSIQVILHRISGVENGMGKKLTSIFYISLFSAL